MTNKINGIDVSECRFYEPKAQKMTCHEEAITKPCESTPICYYKLLQKSYIEIQRLQQENEELKQQFEIDKNQINYFIEENKKLEEEKEKIEEDAEYFLNGDYCDEKCNSAKNELKYEQALEEIRSYCDEQNLKADYTACYITNRIDEVLNDRD